MIACPADCSVALLLSCWGPPFLTLADGGCDSGASAFIGLGAYSYFSGKHQLRLQQTAILKSKSRFGIPSRQAGIATIAATFVGMGIWRLIN